jgi:glycosyltransferase involved in cell wall biosynthesis
LWEAVGGYDSSHPWGVEDWHFWLKCRQHGWNPLALPAPMLHYRVQESASMYTTMMERWDEALAMHHTMLPDCYPPAAVLAGHHRLLDMSPESEERIRRKREKFPGLPLPQLWQGLAHMGRSEWREALACLLKALHLAEPACAWQAAYQLRLLYQRLGLPSKARAMQALCAEGRPELAALFAGQEAIIELARSWAGAPEDKKPRRILLMGEFFWPSLGGIEVFLEHLGVFLLERGFEVHVLTKALPERTALEHNGMVIHEFPSYFNLARGVPGGLDDFDFLLYKCGFSHVICLAHPDPWSMYLCMLPQPRPRVVMLPIFSNFADLMQQGILVPMLRNIEGADHICRITESAGDAQLLELARIPNHFLPHMTPPPASSFRFRDFLGIGPELPLFLHVANFWPSKNHVELIKTMRVLQGDWRMALIGSPHDPACLAEVERAVRGDSRFILLRRQSREVATAAVLEADIVLLGSKGEGCPMIILEAMSAGTPWLVTPDCGSVRDQAGGIVAALRDFPLIILELMADGARRKVLGRLGKEHWEACFSREAVFPAFLELIENGGRNMPDLSMPVRLRAATGVVADEIRHAVLARHGVSISRF